MAKRNLYSLKEALLHPGYAKDLVVFLDKENDPLLFNRLPELVNLTELSLLDGKGCTEIPEGVYELKKLKKLRLRATSVTQISSKIEQLKDLEEIIIEDSPICSLPETIGQLKSLRRLEMRGTQLEALPEAICEAKKLQEICITYSKLKEIPSTIHQIKKLECLEITNAAITRIPDGICELTALEKLSLSANSIEQLPDKLSMLSKLIHLRLEDNKIQVLTLKEPANLKNLSSINLKNNQFKKFPEALLACPKLSYIYLDDNQIDHIPESLIGAKDLVTLSLENNAFIDFPMPLLEWYVNKPNGAYYQGLELDTSLYNHNVTELMQNGTFKKLSRKDKANFYYIRMDNRAKMAEMSMESLYLALNTAATGIANLVLAYLTEKIEKPIEKGSRIFILGKTTDSLTDLKNRIKTCGLEYVNKLEEATHVLISARANKKIKKWPDKMDWQWIMEAHLNAFFDEVDPSFLVESADSDADKVSALIMSLEEENMTIGLSIIEGGGLPENLFTEAFIVYKMSNDAATRKKAYELLKAKASPELLKVIKNRSVLNKKGYVFDQDRRKIEQLVKDYTQDSGLDLGKLAYAVYMKVECCMIDALRYAPAAYKLHILNKAIKNNEFSPSYRNLFEVFPMELLEFPNLKRIYMKIKHGESINGEYKRYNDFELPKEIAKLQQLESLMIIGTVKAPPIKELATMKKLENLTLYVHKGFDVDAAKKTLKHLKEVDLRKAY